MDTRWLNFWENDRYAIGDWGVMFDNDTQVILPTQINSDGYHKITLRLQDGSRKTYSLHRLVALSFVENSDDKPTVNHKDGNKNNNDWRNLEWATRSEQTQHAWDNGLIRDLDSRKEGIRKHQGKPVLCITTNKVYPSLGAACEEIGLKKSNLSAVCRGIKGWKTCGKDKDGTPLEWRFCND